jgi:hypothetical protein
MTTAAPFDPLTDDDVRWLAVRTASSLARLWARMKRFAIQPGRHPMRVLEAREVSLGEPWLSDVPPGTSFDGILFAVQLAQGLLLREAASQKPPDRRQLCLIVQHVSCEATHWSANTLRLAEVLGVGLAARPRDEPASNLHREIYSLDGTYAETKVAMAAGKSDR